MKTTRKMVMILFGMSFILGSLLLNDFNNELNNFQQQVEISPLVASDTHINPDDVTMYLDGNPVNLFFLLIGKDNLVAPHIKLLSRISLLMNNSEIREKINKANTSEEIYSIFEEEEKNIS